MRESGRGVTDGRRNPGTTSDRGVVLAGGPGVVDDRRVRTALNAVAAVVAFYWVLQRFWPAPIGVLLQGVVIGGLTSLLAFGLALVYRSNRIINFAAGDLGGFPGSLGVLLVLGAGVPYLVALPLALVTALAVGALVELVFIRRFFKAPRLILTVVTIAVSQILALGTVLLPELFDDIATSDSFKSPFGIEFSIGRTVFQGNEVIALLAVPIVIAGLIGFLRFTSVGLAIRASAESADRAALLGVPVKRVQMIVWMVATALATLAIFLRAGVVGLPIGTVLGPTILIRALAAAVIGRMERLPTIFVASLALGVIEASVLFSTSRAFLVDPIIFVIVLGALVLQRRGGGRMDDDASSWQSARDVRPIPRELRDLPEVKLGLRAATWGCAAIALALPLVFTESQLNLAGVIAIIAMVGISLVVLTGWAGQVSLGQIAFLGIGAAVGGWLTTTWHWDITLALVGAGVSGAVAAMVIGLPALRIKGLFLAVVTLSFALATSSYVLNPEFMHWLPTERIPRNPLFGRVALHSETRFYYLTIAVLVVSLLMVRGIRRTRTGRIMIGVKENARAAQSFGINATVAKLMAFAVSGFIAAAAGALFVHHQQSLGITPFSVGRSRDAFMMVVIGGLGSVPGAILGAIYLEGFTYFRDSFPTFLRPWLSLLSTSGGVLLVLLLLPGGFSQLLYGGRDKVLRRIADRHGLVVPSLVADVRTDATPATGGDELALDVREVLEDAAAAEIPVEPVDEEVPA